MIMNNPPHPGQILREMYIDPLEVSITNAAEALDVTRQSLSDLVNGKTGISVVMAIRLSIAFNTTPEYWVNLQTQYSLWNARNDDIYDEVQRLVK